jgi:hypothetical protein
MARSRNTEVEEEVVEATEEEVEEAPKARASKRDAVTVVFRAGSREYTRALHGDDFEALAEEFAAKKKGTIV